MRIFSDIMSSEEKRGIIDDVGIENEMTCVLLDGYDDALIGYWIDRTDYGMHAVYDYRKCVECQMEICGMTEEEAIDNLEYNTFRSLPYVEEKSRPVIMNLFGEGDEYRG